MEKEIHSENRFLIFSKTASPGISLDLPLSRD